MLGEKYNYPNYRDLIINLVLNLIKEPNILHLRNNN